MEYGVWVTYYLCGMYWTGMCYIVYLVYIFIC